MLSHVKGQPYSLFCLIGHCFVCSCQVGLRMPSYCPVFICAVPAVLHFVNTVYSLERGLQFWGQFKSDFFNFLLLCCVLPVRLLMQCGK